MFDIPLNYVPPTIDRTKPMHIDRMVDRNLLIKGASAIKPVNNSSFFNNQIIVQPYTIHERSIKRAKEWLEKKNKAYSNSIKEYYEKGGKNGFYGKQHTDETIKFLSKMQRNNKYAAKSVKIHDIIYESLTAAGKELGVSGNTIRRRIDKNITGYELV